MIGSTISHYRIVSKIGQGGMGVVYKAEDTRLQRPVALKFLPPDSLEEHDKERFLSEARNAALIHHPNICPIYDVDESGGQLFFAMAYLEGQPLSSLINGRPLDAGRAIDIAIQIANGLEAAHKRGIVHRDIKASNIIISGQGHAYILDFGIALRHGSPRLTVAGGVVGTPAYMSPEQAQGFDVDHRTDIWSLGVVLFEMLTGRPPFRRDRDIAVIHAIIHDAAPSVAELRPGAPAPLPGIVETALAKRPDERWQSAGQMAAELRSLQGSQTSRPIDGTTVTMIRPPARPRRRLAIAAIVVMALVALAGFLWQLGIFPFRPRLPEEKHIAVLPFQVSGSDESVRAISDGLVEIITTKLSQMEQFQGKALVVPASEIRSSKIVSAAEAHRVYGANLVITGSAQLLGDLIQFTVNLVDPVRMVQLGARSFDFNKKNPILLRDGALNGVLKLLEIELSPAARQSVAAGETSASGAYADYLKGRGYLARYDVSGNIDLALASFQSATKQDPNFALAHAGLAEVYMMKAGLTGDKHWSDRAIENAQKAVEIDGNLAVGHIKLGEIYATTGREDEGIRELQHALELSPSNADAYRELAGVYANLGRFAEAEAAYLEATKRRPTDWIAQVLLARFYRQRGRYPEAEAAYGRAKALTPDNALIYRLLAEAYRSQGRYSDARAQLQTALKIGPTAKAYSALGLAYHFEHRFQEAASALEAAIDLDSSGYVAWGNLGMVYQWIPNQKGKAQPALRRAIELGEKQLQVTPKDYDIRANLAEYRARLGESKQALQELSAIPDALHPQFSARIILVYELLGMRKEAVDGVRNLRDPATLNDIKNDPDLERLWADPSVQEIVQRLAGNSSR